MSQRKWLVLWALGVLLLASACSKDSSADNGEASGDTAAAEQGDDTRATAGAGEAVATPAGESDKAAAAPAAESGKVYGTGVKQSESVDIAELIANPEKYAGQNIRVEGTVSDVCPKRGCWMEMAGDKPGSKVRFKVRDGVITFPLDAKGKYAVAEGVVNTRQLTLEETREYLKYQAEEYGKDVDPAGVTEPMTVVRLDGKGAVIRDSK